MTIPNEEGYYNQFDPAKRYVEVRARAGYPPQSQEFNELQAISRGIQQALTDVLFKEGSIIKADEGVFTQSADGLTLEMRAISFYASGLIHEVPAATLSLPATGYAYVGVRVTETLVTADQDDTLLDPAVEELNYGQPGANRLQVTADWEVRTSADASAGFIPVYTFLDKQQQVAVAVGQLDPVTRTLARRTYDESGNYVVNGFDLSVEPSTATDATTFRLKVNNRNDANKAGSTAYVQGNQIIKLVPEYLDVDMALETASAIDTFHRYTAREGVDGGYTLANHRFLLLKQPAAAISAVYAFFDKVVTVTGHSLNGFDEIPLSQGESLAQVMQVFSAGDTSDAAVADPERIYLDASNNIGLGAYYLQGTRLYWNPIPASDADAWDVSVSYLKGSVVKYLDRDGVDRYWRARTQLVPAGKPPVKDLAGTIDTDYWQEVYLSEPDANETYHVYLRYQRALTEDEFSLYVNEEQQGYLDLSYFVTTPSAQKPFVTNKADGSTPGSDLRIEYSYHLARVDVVYLDGAGDLRLAKGQSAEKPVAPPVLPDVLALGSLAIGAGQGDTGTVVTTYNVKRLTMLELRELVERLNRAEYNTAINDLNNQALQRAGGNANLRGIVTESFVYTTTNLAKRELRYDVYATSQRSLDLLDQKFSLPLTSYSATDASVPYRLVLTQSSSAQKRSGGEKLITLTRAEVDTELSAELGQTKATSALQVNQFDEFVLQPTLKLAQQDNGAVEETPPLTSIDATNFIQLIHNYEFDWQAYTTGRDAYKAKLNTATSQNVGIPGFMKPVENTATGSGFPAFAFIELRVDGRRPYLKTPTIGTLRSDHGEVLTGGTESFTLMNGTVLTAYPATCIIQASAEGTFTVPFYIPEGIASGTVAVEARVLFTEANIAAQAAYKATKLIQVVDNTAELAQLVRLIESPKNQYPPKLASTPIRIYRVVNGAREPASIDNLTLVGSETAKLEIDVHYQRATNNTSIGTPSEVVVQLLSATGQTVLPTGQQTFNLATKQVVPSTQTTPLTLTVHPATGTEGRLTFSGQGLNAVKFPFKVVVGLFNGNTKQVSAEQILKVGGATPSTSTATVTLVNGASEITAQAPNNVVIEAEVTNASSVTVEGLPATATVTVTDI